MIRCTNCGKELADGSKFCDGCGAKQCEYLICPSCGELNEPDNTFCQSCGASVKIPVVPIQSDSAIKEKKKRSKKAIIFSAIGVIVVVAILVPILLIFGGEETKNSFALYLKDGNMYFSDLERGGESIRITSNLVDEDYASSEAGGFDYKTRISEDGKYIFFPDRFESGDDGYNLYYRELGNTEAASVKIDSDVRTYVINDNATIVTYRKGSERNLYQYKLADSSKNKIGSEVYSYDVSDDGKKVIYQNSEDDLYFVKDGEKVKIAGEVSRIEYYSDNFTTLYYIKDEALYKYANGEKTKIVSDVSSVFKIYDSGEIYYITSRLEEHCLADYVEDDMAEADATIEKAETPDYPTAPTRSDYDSYDEFTTAYEAYYREYKRLKEEYDEAVEAYWAKYDRDELRNELSETKISQTKYSLWFYDGTKAELVTDEFFLGYNYEYPCASETPVIAYRQSKQSDMQKSIKLSSVNSVIEVKNQVDEGTSFEYEACAAVKGTAKTLVGENATVTWFLVNDAGTMIYYADNVDNGYGDLYRVTVDNGAVGKPELYDSDVDVYPDLCRYLDDSTLVYFKDYSYEDGGDMYIGKRMVDSGARSGYLNGNNPGEFYYYSDYNYDKYYGTLKCWDGKKSVTIADDVYHGFRISEGHVLYATDYNENRQNYTLYIYDGKNSTKIADDVYSYDILPDGRVLYLYDYSTKYHKGELYVWNGGKAKKIDDDVVYLFGYWN